MKILDQFKKLVEYMKKLMNNRDKKKLVENALIIVIIGAIIIIASGSLFSGNSNSSGLEKQDEEVTESASRIDDSEDSDELEKELEMILSQIDGAGKVSVMITYVSGREIVPAYDTRRSENDTEERDNEGGTRKIRQEEYENSIAYIHEQGGSKEPIIIKDFKPVVKGVVVVCDGAENPVVKDNVIKAVQALTDVPIHKIQVFKREK